MVDCRTFSLLSLVTMWVQVIQDLLKEHKRDKESSDRDPVDDYTHPNRSAIRLSKYFVGSRSFNGRFRDKCRDDNVFFGKRPASPTFPT